MKQRLLFSLFLLTLITVTSFTPHTTAENQQRKAPEPRVEVITRPEWISGQVAVHIFNHPKDGTTLESDTVTIQVAVWGTEQTRPLYIILDGNIAARIETPGYYRYEWNLHGSHHLTIRDDYTLFKTAEFTIAPPPPPIPTVAKSFMEEQLAEQKIQVFALMLVASIVGTSTGGTLKRRTKIFTAWAMVPYGLLLTMGTAKLETLYPMIPLALSGVISYVLAGGYADETLALVATEGQIIAKTYTMDDENHAVMGFGPKHWRTGFIHKTPIELQDHNHPIEFQGFNVKLTCAVVQGLENIKETKEGIKIQCSPALARALTEAGVIEDLEEKLADTHYRTIFMEQALNGVISSVIMEMETLMNELKIDQVSTISEAREKVEEASNKLKKQIQDITPEQPPEKEVNPVD